MSKEAQGFLEQQASEKYLQDHGFSYPDTPVFKAAKGLSTETVKEISWQKQEPEWILNYRLQALKVFDTLPLPQWGPDLSALDFHSIHYYNRPTEEQTRSWDEVPQNIKNTFERLGIPQAEREFLAGVGTQYDSEIVYHNLRKDLEEQGVIFISPEQAIQDHPALVKQYFGTIVPVNDNKFAALNSAVWSGGSFVYVPKGVKVEIPIQAYFRINSRNFGQFERTLIIADEGSFVHYVEGCTAPTFSQHSLHSAVVEIVAERGARVRYTTIQNWSHNVYNLVTKRAHAKEDAIVEWVDGNIGSLVTMKYPAIHLLGARAHGEVLSIAFAGEKQQQDTGAKILHLADNTSSMITSKSISQKGGIANYRGLVHVAADVRNTKTKVECDALLLDATAKTSTYPYMQVLSEDAKVEHEATVSKIEEEKIFYLSSRGISEQEAAQMIVNGFIDPLVKELPMEYALELNRLIALEMEGSVG